MAKFIITHKRGDTLMFAGRCKLPGSGWAATAALGQDGDDAPIALLTVGLGAMVTPDVDGYTHTIIIEHAALGQENWPIATLDCDVQYVRDDGFVRSTPTFKVKVVRDVTPP